MPEVKMTPTPVSEGEAALAFVHRILPRVNAPFKESGELLMAQLWLETARGKSMMNHNWGNLTANSSWPGDFWRPPWFNLDEVNALPDGAEKTKLQRLHQGMLEGKVPQKFRAYATLVAGLEDYIKRLLFDFPSLVEAARTGDPATFATAIRTSKFTPDSNDESMTRTIASIAGEFAKRGLFAGLPSVPKASAPVPASSLDLLSSRLPELSSSEPLPSSPVLTVGELENGETPTVPASGELPGLMLGSVGSAVELFRFLTIGGSGMLTEQDIEELVKPWQRDHKLDDDGVVDHHTWKAVLDEHELRRK